MPHPKFYRFVGYGQVELVVEPPNPEDGERVVEVKSAYISVVEGHKKV